MFIVNGLRFSSIAAERDYDDRLENTGREIRVEYRENHRPANPQGGDCTHRPRRRHPALDSV